MASLEDIFTTSSELLLKASLYLSHYYILVGAWTAPNQVQAAGNRTIMTLFQVNLTPLLATITTEIVS